MPTNRVLIYSAVEPAVVHALTENRRFFLSWYTAFLSRIGSKYFSTLPLSPVSIDCITANVPGP